MSTFIPEQLIEPLQLYEHAMSIYPDFNSELFQSQVSEILEMIIKHEYGDDILDAVSTTTAARQLATKDKRAAKVKSECRSWKGEEILQSKEKLAKIESEWLTMVPQEQIFECLNAYRNGTIWKTPGIRKTQSLLKVT